MSHCGGKRLVMPCDSKWLYVLLPYARYCSVASSSLAFQALLFNGHAGFAVVAAPRYVICCSCQRHIVLLLWATFSLQAIRSYVQQDVASESC